MSVFWILAAVVLIYLLMRAFNRTDRTATPPPTADEKQQLEQTLDAVARLHGPQRTRLWEQIGAFLADKDFYGCNGLDVTREMALVIAAYACLLTLRRDGAPYPQLRSVLVYPDAFLVRDPEPDELGIVHEEPEVRIGESWDAQRIVLSWPDVEDAMAGGPTNVVVHECAHQLDPDGVGRPPDVRDPAWPAAMAAAYATLCREPSAVIDDYGAESPAEFFAVAVESYVQRPEALAAHHSDVHRCLERYFRCAPALGGIDG